MAPRRRRPSGDGTLRQRANGLWEVRDTVDGRQVSFYGKTLAAARAKAAQARQAGHTGREHTLGGWLTGWLEGQRGALKAQTWRRYEQLVRLHVVPALGHLRLADLREKHLTDLYGRLARPTGPLGETTVHHVHTVLGTGLEAAVRQGQLVRNPARSVTAPRMRHRSKVILTREEAARLIAAAMAEPMGAAYVLAVTIGARSGELRALRWRDVDLERGTVTISGNLVVGYSGERELDDPKTSAGRRTVRIPAVAVEALGRTPRQGVLVFVSEAGKPLEAGSLGRWYFRPILARAGLAPMPLHDLRHTAATHILEDGVPAHVVARVLGHATVGVTLAIYAHVTAAMTEAAVAAMDARYPVEGTGKGTVRALCPEILDTQAPPP
jgi:integrase